MLFLFIRIFYSALSTAECMKIYSSGSWIPKKLMHSICFTFYCVDSLVYSNVIHICFLDSVSDHILHARRCCDFVLFLYCLQSTLFQTLVLINVFLVLVDTATTVILPCHTVYSEGNAQFLYISHAKRMVTFRYLEMSNSLSFRLRSLFCLFPRFLHLSTLCQF
jgi:hypothetical protein